MSNYTYRIHTMTNTLTVLGALFLGVVLGYGYGHSTASTVPFATLDQMQSAAVTASFGQQQAPRLSSMFTGLKNLQGRALERAYLEHMIVYRQGEVEMARLIGNKTTWPEMRTFTSNIIISHTRDIKLMKEWLDLWF